MWDFFNIKILNMQTKQKIKIAIQGGFGAFHEIAARHYFQSEDIEIIPRETFKDLFHSLKTRGVDFGIVAIENSLVGSILSNYTLIRNSNKKIVGEIYLKINQNLLALKGQNISNIKEVYSHPMALLQCQAFFEENPHIKPKESVDTALSAKEIYDKQLKGVGAIASNFAAEKYQLEVLATNIESDKKNYTRFLILSDADESSKTNHVDKSSMVFSLAHETGSLSKVLTIFSFYDINLSKIQSMPLVGSEWEYLFYVDVEFNNYTMYKKSLEAITPFINVFENFGEYRKGIKI